MYSMSGRAERLDATRTYRIFSVYMGFRQDRCLKSEMGPQIPLNSIVTKVWVLGVYNNAAGQNRSWRKTVYTEKIRYEGTAGWWQWWDSRGGKQHSYLILFMRMLLMHHSSLTLLMHIPVLLCNTHPSPFLCTYFLCNTHPHASYASSAWPCWLFSKI